MVRGCSELNCAEADTSFSDYSIDHAFRLINSASTMLFVIASSKKVIHAIVCWTIAISYIPFERIFLMHYRFFLVNAAIVIVLGAVWKQKQSCRRESMPLANDQSRELTAIDTAIRVLDFGIRHWSKSSAKNSAEVHHLPSAMTPLHLPQHLALLPRVRHLTIAVLQCLPNCLKTRTRPAKA